MKALDDIKAALAATEELKAATQESLAAASALDQKIAAVQAALDNAPIPRHWKVTVTAGEIDVSERDAAPLLAGALLAFDGKPGSVALLSGKIDLGMGDLEQIAAVMAGRPQANPSP